VIPLFPIDKDYSLCRKTYFDTFREHIVQCREFPGLKYMHCLVMGVLNDIFRQTRVSMKNDAS